MLIEPALRETSRELLAVRDQLLAAGLQVVAPCFFQGPCPALRLGTRLVPRRRADPGQRARVDFSYLVLSAGRPTAGAAELHRVVSDPHAREGPPAPVRLRRRTAGTS